MMLHRQVEIAPFCGKFNLLGARRAKFPETALFDPQVIIFLRTDGNEAFTLGL
jgi:hypothetical protein